MKNNHKNIKIFLRKLSYSNKYFFKGLDSFRNNFFLFKHIFIRWKVFFLFLFVEKKAIKAVKRKNLKIFLRILYIYIVINTFINSRKISMQFEN